MDPKIMVGKPIIEGTRIPIDATVKRLAEGLSIKGILEDFPNLEVEDIKEALNYCVKVVNGEDVVLISKGDL